MYRTLRSSSDDDTSSSSNTITSAEKSRHTRSIVKIDDISGIKTLSKVSFASALCATTDKIRVLKDWNIAPKLGRAWNGMASWKSEKTVQLLIPTIDGTEKCTASLSAVFAPANSDIKGYLRIHNPEGSSFDMCFQGGWYPDEPKTGLIIRYPKHLSSGKITTDDEGALFEDPLPETDDLWLFARDRAMWWADSKTDSELRALLPGTALSDTEGLKQQIIAMIEDVHGAGYKLQQMDFDTALRNESSLFKRFVRSVMSSSY